MRRSVGIVGLGAALVSSGCGIMTRPKQPGLGVVGSVQWSGSTELSASTVLDDGRNDWFVLGRVGMEYLLEHRFTVGLHATQVELRSGDLRQSQSWLGEDLGYLLHLGGRSWLWPHVGVEFSEVSIDYGPGPDQEQEGYLDMDAYVDVLYVHEFTPAVHVRVGPRYNFDGTLSLNWDLGVFLGAL